MRRTSIEEEDDMQGSLFETKIRILHGVILSNQELIHAQTQQISALKRQLEKVREGKGYAHQMITNNNHQITNNTAKVTVNSKHIPTTAATIDTTIPCVQCNQRIRQLQQQLVSTKLKLAEQYSNSLEQHITIQSLHKEHLILSQQLQMFSNKSQQEEAVQEQYNQQQSINVKQQGLHGELINKGNIGLWIGSINQERHQNHQLNNQYQHSLQINNLHQSTTHINKPQLDRQFKQVVKSNYPLKYSQSQQATKLFKLWSKHIQKQRKRFHKHNLLSTPSLYSTFHSIFNQKNYTDKDAFSKNTFPLLIKYHGVPLELRRVVWSLLINDKLALTQLLYSKLSQKSLQLNGTELSVKQQIRKDMVRSFNGECNINNLFKIYIKTHQLYNINSPSTNIVHQPKQLKHQQSIQKQQQNQQNIQQRQQTQQNQLNTNKESIQQQQQQIAVQIALVRKQTIETSETQAVQVVPMIQVSEDLHMLSLQRKSTTHHHLPQTNSNHIIISSPKQQIFPIPQLATRTLQIFSLYRPDIGFIQGMTYPTIILTLVLQQYDVFRVLANVLLTRQFFLKMITVEEGFVDAICRVFEDMLYERDVRLYDRLVNELAVKSEVYVVDWFWTFYSRNLSPNAILKIWDLIIYHYSISSAHPQLILFQMALTILQLLSPILYQTNYQQTIRTIREYWRKIDENEMIERLYDGICQWEEIEKLYKRGFEKMGKKLRVRGVER